MVYKISEYRDKLVFILNHYYNNDKALAEKSADNLLNFFGFGYRFPDNHLSQEDRLLFNDLRDFGLLEVEREEARLYNGRDWILYFWKYTSAFLDDQLESNIDIELTSKVISEFADFVNAHKQVDKQKQVYENVPDEVWSRLTPDKSPASPA